MAESESIKEIVNPTAMQAATVIMVAFRATKTGCKPATMQSQ